MTFHPHNDGQSERTILKLEDMLQACMLDFGGRWDTYISLVEFSYNNNYHLATTDLLSRCFMGGYVGPRFIGEMFIRES